MLQHFPLVTTFPSNYCCLQFLSFHSLFYLFRQLSTPSHLGNSHHVSQMTILPNLVETFVFTSYLPLSGTTVRDNKLLMNHFFLFTSLGFLPLLRLLSLSLCVFLFLYWISKYCISSCTSFRTLFFTLSLNNFRY